MFDLSPSHIAILLIIVVLLFGATRLPKAAKSLGQSMHIFKKEVQGLSSDTQDTAANPAPQTFSALPAPDPTQQQLSDLQRQVAQLQQQAAGTVQDGQPTQTQQPL